MATKQKLCVNCKHCDTESYWIPHCVRELEVTRRKSSVTGRVHTYTSGEKRCDDERYYSTSKRCGPDAQFYEEGRLYKHIISWFK